MRIRHPALKTNVLKLIGTYEMDLELSPEFGFPLRFEVFQDTELRNSFRIHIWELEHFNLEPTFSVRRRGKRLRYKSTELIMLERGDKLTGAYDCLRAKNATEALAKVTADLKERLEHWTGVKAK